MKMLSLEPDEDMKWIYDYQHPEYNSDHARGLRERRDRELRSAPRWMIEEARMNDIMLKTTPNVEFSGQAASPRSSAGTQG